MKLLIKLTVLSTVLYLCSSAQFTAPYFGTALTVAQGSIPLTEDIAFYTPSDDSACTRAQHDSSAPIVANPQTTAIDKLLFFHGGRGAQGMTLTSAFAASCESVHAPKKDIIQSAVRQITQANIAMTLKGNPKVQPYLPREDTPNKKYTSSPSLVDATFIPLTSSQLY